MNTVLRRWPFPIRLTRATTRTDPTPLPTTSVFRPASPSHSWTSGGRVSKPMISTSSISQPREAWGPVRVVLHRGAGSAPSRGLLPAALAEEEQPERGVEVGALGLATRPDRLDPQR